MILLLTMQSPKWQRQQLYQIGCEFRRELDLDWTPFTDVLDGEHPFLIMDDDDPIGGGTVVLQAKRGRLPTGPTLKWIWIAPSHRRQGLLRCTWEELKGAFPDLVPQTPLSLGAAKFFNSRDDVPAAMRPLHTW